MKTFRLLSILMALMILAASGQVFALSAEQKRVLQSGVYYFNTEVDQKTATCTPSASAAEPGPVYLVGDSIGEAIKPGLLTSFGSGGWNLKANVLRSRNLAGTPPSPDGLAAIDVDAEFIKTTKAVVVELGTNTSGLTVNNVGQMVDKIRALSPNATIYWVDTAVKRADIQKFNDVNSIIHTQSTQKGFNVISWSKKVFGDSSDPKNMNPNAPDSDYINSADKVHLTEQGVAAMVELITGAVTKGGAGGCACTLLAGNDNPEKVWNFFISKGLTPPQAAGIMGNLQAESAGFNPKRVEGGHMEGGKWVNRPPFQFPPEMDTMPPNVGPQGQPGYGIVQWTSPGRKKGLENKATSTGKPVYDLGVQLEWLFEEATARGDMDKLKQSSSAADAAFIWHKYYEISNDGPERIQNRINAANDFLARYGSITPSGGGSCS